MSDVTPDEAHRALVEAYGAEHHQSREIADIAPFHDGATSYLVKFEQFTDDDGSLPDDLDADTKRQLRTAHTVLQKATTGIEKTAADRLEAVETDGESQ